MEGFDKASRGLGNAVYFGRTGLGDYRDPEESRLLENEIIGGHARQV
jgi:hypothetical protein